MPFGVGWMGGEKGTAGDEGPPEHGDADARHGEEVFYTAWPAIIGLSFGLVAAAILLILKGLSTLGGLLLFGYFFALLALFIYTEIQRWPVVSEATIRRYRESGLGEGLEAIGSAGLPVGLFLVTEALFFGTAFSVYFLFRFQFAVWPPPGSPHLDDLIPRIQTLSLIMSSIMIEAVIWGLKRGRALLVRAGVVVTTALAALFAILQFGIEWPKLLFEEGFTFTSNFLATSFYLLTGIHGSHVVAGVGAFAVVTARAFKGHFTPGSHGFLEGTATYWHFVHIVWLFLFILFWEGGLIFR